MSRFRADHSFVQRRQLAQRIRILHPEQLPIVLESRLALVKSKILAPADTTMAKLALVVRQQLVEPPTAVFLFVASRSALLPLSALVGQVHAQFADADGFLYVRVETDSPFG